MFLSFIISGCTQLDVGTDGKRLQAMVNSDFVLSFTSVGGFSEEYAKIEYKQDYDNPLTIESSVGRQISIRNEYSLTAPIGDIVTRIILSGVIDLPSENKKEQHLGRDLARIEINYTDNNVSKTIVRDYSWGNKFERSFHRAENLFRELILLNSPIEQLQSSPSAP